MAVTGLPKPQPFHAVIMAKFADECRVRMRVVVEDLADALGPKTMDLKLRIGLHSGKGGHCSESMPHITLFLILSFLSFSAGPVTAGVLRGDKARFQLFGDSMNTAARMEAFSAPDKIHVSESTANELRKSGKGDWVIAREVR